MTKKIVYLSTAKKVQNAIQSRIERGEDISNIVWLCMDNKNRWPSLLEGVTVEITDIFNIGHEVIKKHGATVIGECKPFTLEECFYVLERKLNSNINAKDSIEEIRGECSQYTWSQFRRDITKYSREAHTKVKS